MDNDLSHMRITIWVTFATLALVILFATFPSIDLSFSALFFSPVEQPWSGREPFPEWLRDTLREGTELATLLAFMILVGNLRLGTLQRTGWRVWAFLCGPVILCVGLLVNVVLKATIGRARPFSVTEFGGQQLFTSSAQMFDERGRGFVLKGNRAQTESRGRHPYMARDDAKELVSRVLAAYRTHHKTLPARVIVLKTSRFRQDEAEGIYEALDEAGTELRDLVWVPAHLWFAGGGETVALVPSRYVGSGAAADGALRLSRKTEWLPIGPDQYQGMGQRLLTTSASEQGLLQVREIVLHGDAAGAAAA